jgi:hypothetical protein
MMGVTSVIAAVTIQLRVTLSFIPGISAAVAEDGYKNVRAANV